MEDRNNINPIQAEEMPVAQAAVAGKAKASEPWANRRFVLYDKLKITKVVVDVIIIGASALLILMLFLGMRH